MALACVTSGRGARAEVPFDVALAAENDDFPPSAGGEETSTEPPSGGDRALAAGAAIVPGLLIHGTGNYVLQRQQTALRLLLLQGVGLGLLGIGGTVIAATGAARDFVGPGAALAIVGGGLFTSSALADLYGVLAPPGGLGVDPGWVPRFEAELGYRYVYDPQFAYRHFLVNGLHGRLGQFRLSPSMWASPDTAHERLRAELAYRFFGPVPGSMRTDGSYLEVEAAYTDQRFGFEEIALRTVEASVEMRWDLSTYDPFLAGSFLDFGLGVANQIHDFGPGVPGQQSFTMLLGGFGFGVYLGDQWPQGGYVRAYYDHRHDGFAAGLLAPGLLSGVLGHFGLEGRYYFTEHWGLRAEAQVGSALVTGISAVFRAGGDR